MKVENVKVNDLEESIRGAKFPMSVNVDSLNSELTPGIAKLAQSNKGEGHDQFLTGITVSFDLTCSNKMWVEMERYKFVNFVSSQSTMHRIAKFDLGKQYNEYVDKSIIQRMIELKTIYNQEQTPENYLRLLYSNPAGMELTARLTTNYRALKTVYSQRKNHRLPEWRKFCKWIETLPYADELIIGKENKQEDNLQV